ncbi:MAG: DUF2325 domain-containing protein [Pseudomonadota bacterium]|uniref:DUF2325 domain-containing protein n=1 Tax=Thermithiobacillus tepidarius TaxID=929 RepID=UPI0004078EF4|nr:DUF2325 domain-containing protein [Thermithiobacillus tepidarius]
MHAVLVGADQLGNIPKVLQRFGIRIEAHISGRDPAHQRKLPGLPRRANLVVLFTDFLGHNVMRHYRQLAQRAGVPVLACRRSAACLEQELQCALGRVPRARSDNANGNQDLPCAHCPHRTR